MTARTGWISPPQVSAGQDHLGTQAPCVLIYAQLIPGITNVTDRARYYSFYPWLIWTCNARHRDMTHEKFVDLLRRADCLFTMIAAAHDPEGLDPERHGAATTGTQTLNRIARRLQPNDLVKLDTYTARHEESATRYFKNPMGGLGQYYAGTLLNLELLDGAKPPKVETLGESLAQAFDRAVPGERFWTIIEKGDVRGSDLVELKAFCPCHLASAAEERNVLLDIFFDWPKRYGPDGAQRQATLAMLLDLANSLFLATGKELDIDAFRAAVYAGMLSPQHPWQPPAFLERTVRSWSCYVRSDILSVAMLEAFAIALKELGGTPHRPASIEALADSLVARVEVQQALADLAAPTFGALCESMRTMAPDLQDHCAPGHELQWIIDVMRRNDRREGAHRPALLAEVVRALATLHIRDDLAAPAFGPVPIAPAALRDSPINLLTFRERCETWRGLPIASFAVQLVTWCMETHLQVALRKLREGSKDTFQFHPSERGLEWHMHVPVPSQTTPRFKQAMRILRDLAALDSSGLTPSGSTLLERAGG